MLQEQVNQLFPDQLARWPAVGKRYEDVEQALLRRFDIGGVEVVCQCNEGRIRSTTARIDAASLAARPCFLCLQNQPEEQLTIESGSFRIQVNPFPVLVPHYTVVSRRHDPQSLLPHLPELLRLTAELPDLCLFYNGPRSGASAPDHAHFQAVGRHELPIMRQLGWKDKTLVAQTVQSSTWHWQHYLRSVVEIEAAGESAAAEALAAYVPADRLEPDLNLICFHEQHRWHMLLFPRQQLRPWQFSSEDESRRLLVSPATVEMAGLWVMPVREHFNRITADDIKDIYQQCSKPLAHTGLQNL